MMRSQCRRSAGAGLLALLLVVTACTAEDEATPTGQDGSVVSGDAVEEAPEPDAAGDPDTADEPGGADAAEAPVESDPASASGPAEPGPVDQLYVRGDDVIDDAELAALRAIPGIATVPAARRDDVALWGSSRADGTPVDDLPLDFKISVSVEVDRPELPVHPGPGEVLLTEAGRQFRDLDVGGTIVLGDAADKVTRTVAGIVDDPALSEVEFIVTEQDADAIGVRTRQRTLIELTAGADPAAVTEQVMAVLGPRTVVQERSSQDRAMVLSLPATKLRFGEFAFKDLPGRDVQAGVSWTSEYIAPVRIPILGRITCNRMIFDDLVTAFEEIEAAGLAGEIDPALYGGCWTPRRINRNANLSRHAWGIAIDLNVDFDAPGHGPEPSEEIIEIFERNGFRWGGDYPFPDNHHFEWVGF